jgi:hypothetical protein
MSNSEYDFDVPLPDARRGRTAGGNTPTAIIRGLPVGGSRFFVGYTNNRLNNIYQALKSKEKLPFKVTIRKVTEEGVEGVRVWRLDAE